MKGLEIVLDIDRLEIYQVIDHDESPAVEKETVTANLSDTMTNRPQSIHQEVQLNLFETMGL